MALGTIVPRGPRTPRLPVNRQPNPMAGASGMWRNYRNSLRSMTPQQRRAMTPAEKIQRQQLYFGIGNAPAAKYRARTAKFRAS